MPTTFENQLEKLKEVKVSLSGMVASIRNDKVQNGLIDLNEEIKLALERVSSINPNASAPEKDGLLRKNINDIVKKLDAFKKTHIGYLYLNDDLLDQLSRCSKVLVESAYVLMNTDETRAFRRKEDLAAMDKLTPEEKARFSLMQPIRKGPVDDQSKPKAKPEEPSSNIKNEP